MFTVLLRAVSFTFIIAIGIIMRSTGSYEKCRGFYKEGAAFCDPTLYDYY